jgi:lipopolysaccharide transport system permease protein
LWLSAITVFIRDVIQILPTILTVLMFVTPIFYPFASMPIIIQKISLVNPIYQIVESYRVIIIDNQMPSMIGLGYVALVSLSIFYFGLVVFRRAKGSFDSAI